MKLFIVLVASLVSAADGVADTCPISCQNGECKLGSSDWGDQPLDSNGNPFEFHKGITNDGWFCDCPDDFTGLRCSRPMEKCDEKGHYCYHGGQCIAGLNNTVSNEHLYCDCSTAHYNGHKFSGKYCEIIADLCGNGPEFCVNGGTCQDGKETKDACKCDNKHSGLHCEFDKGHVPDCDLDCSNGGKCTLGIKTYVDALYDKFWDQHDGNFQYCTCAEGWFGDKCKRKGNTCGDKHCFNGGTCVSTLTSSGQTEFKCDCSTAVTDEKSFSGDYCQSESTSFCTKNEDHNGHLFCTNGGTCKEDSHEGCECPDGYHGDICEFTDGEEEEPCSLQCENRGRCRKGKKDTEIIKQFGEELQKYDKTHNLWEHCVCPDGFFGILCEHKMEICPGGAHVCLHGSSCVAQDEVGEDGKTYTCDCDDGFDAVEKFAGKFCQYISTDICTKSGQPGVGKASLAFCVNNGTCKSKVEDNERHPGCDCTPGFEGNHCELLKGSSSNSNPSTDNTSSEAKTSGEEGSEQGLIIGLIVVVLGLFFVVVLVLIRRFVTRNNVTAVTANEKAADLSASEAEPKTLNDFESSGPTPFEAEETVVADPSESPEEPDLQTVEII